MCVLGGTRLLLANPAEQNPLLRSRPSYTEQLSAVSSEGLEPPITGSKPVVISISPRGLVPLIYLTLIPYIVAREKSRIKRKEAPHNDSCDASGFWFAPSVSGATM